jgi:PTS system nitrogen regulatory IIA component
MSLITDVLPLDHVFLDLDLTSKKRLFEQVGILFENSHGIARSAVFDALFEREKLGSTGLGQGVAIPHGRIRGLKQAKGAFVRLLTPIPFESPDGKPVQLAFILLVPEQATEVHLQLLSELATRFSDRKLRAALLTAPDSKTAHALLTQ